jgi:hypothetical protein
MDPEYTAAMATSLRSAPRIASLSSAPPWTAFVSEQRGGPGSWPPVPAPEARANDIDKLAERETTMQLANMQDVGGCRAVVYHRPGPPHPTQDREEPLQAERKAREGQRLHRAATDHRLSRVHTIVVYDGRRIEVQVRTPVMHQWAIAVERLGGGTSSRI